MGIRAEIEDHLAKLVRTWRWAGTAAFAAALSLVAAPATPDAGGGDPSAAEVSAAETGAANGSLQTIETGKVLFTTTRDGRWTAVIPVWSGENLIELGGYVLYAEDDGGRLNERVNTSRGGVHVADGANAIGKCSEGTAGGFRAPAPDPDDDGDGSIDEDRLDGVDNDNDGRIDEDFAAIGDQMIATSFCAPATPGDESGKPGLVFHQEAYAWSLPHIDGAVMLTLRVANVGTEVLRGVRVGAFFETDGPVAIRTESIAPPKSGPTDQDGEMTVCEGANGTVMALVAFPMTGAGEVPWTLGYSAAADNWNQAVIDRLNLDVEAAPTTTERDGQSDLNRVDDRAAVYAVSPAIDALDPGGEIRVDLALVVSPRRQTITTAAANAYETYLGDGVNRYLPPPVSMTPRVIWGTYHPYAPSDSGIEGVNITIEPLGDTPVTPEMISYFSGLGPEALVRRDGQPGAGGLMIRGDTIERLALKGERIALKGRLEDGEFFELILRPEEGSAAGTTRAIGGDFEAELFWKTDGKLEQNLLNSSPNPFRDATTISYEVPALIEKDDGTFVRSPETLDTSVKVYNVMGRLVNVLVEGVSGPGMHTIDWRAIDDNGSPVASGVYYVKLQIGKKYITKRLILLK